ncbi:hypothetical protein PIB30_020857 [Stylosanthes scabra]|uniref:Early nodulin-75 n=1 Tax=Stylosanthes scabra TaxID=79078 RepID=A0ABU6V6Y9_9FABA|nr:hypothetical protein [Stylosanthes scabra]
MLLYTNFPKKKKTYHSQTTASVSNTITLTGHKAITWSVVGEPLTASSCSISAILETVNTLFLLSCCDMASPPPKPESKNETQEFVGKPSSSEEPPPYQPGFFSHYMPDYLSRDETQEPSASEWPPPYKPGKPIIHPYHIVPKYRPEDETQESVGKPSSSEEPPPYQPGFFSHYKPGDETQESAGKPSSSDWPPPYKPGKPVLHPYHIVPKYRPEDETLESVGKPSSSEEPPPYQQVKFMEHYSDTQKRGQ